MLRPGRWVCKVGGGLAPLPPRPAPFSVLEGGPWSDTMSCGIAGRPVEPSAAPAPTDAWGQEAGQLSRGWTPVRTGLRPSSAVLDRAAVQPLPVCDRHAV